VGEDPRDLRDMIIRAIGCEENEAWARRIE
jgi:hypothetical protein